MYNSLVVRFLAKLWDVFTFNYQYSLVKKLVDLIRRLVRFLFKGSFVKEIFVSDKGIIDNSFFYRIYSLIIDFISNILKGCNLYFKRIGVYSVLYRNTKSLFKDDKELLSSVMKFMLFFSLGIILINLGRGFFSGSSYLVAFSLIILSIIGLYFRENYRNILNNSFIIGFIKGIFAIDEGGDKWW